MLRVNVTERILLERVRLFLRDDGGFLRSLSNGGVLLLARALVGFCPVLAQRAVEALDAELQRQQCREDL